MGIWKINSIHKKRGRGRRWEDEGGRSSEYKKIKEEDEEWGDEGRR